jgi:hypothetical protein
MALSAHGESPTKVSIFRLAQFPVGE